MLGLRSACLLLLLLLLLATRRVCPVGMVECMGMSGRAGTFLAPCVDGVAVGVFCWAKGGQDAKTTWLAGRPTLLLLLHQADRPPGHDVTTLMNYLWPVVCVVNG